MIFKSLLERRRKLKKYAHIVAGFVILIHAYEKYESGHGPYLIFTIAGLIFLSVAFFHRIIEKKAPWIDGFFFFIEGILSVFVAIDFFHMGKKALPYTYIFLSLIQFFMAFRKSRKGIEAHKNSHPVITPEEEPISEKSN
jgi:hypothetical protein